MLAHQWLQKILKLDIETHPPINQYGFHSITSGDYEDPSGHVQEFHLEKCPSCGMSIEGGETKQMYWTHNAETCRLVNLVFLELGVSFDEFIRVEIYPASGPLRGYYTTLNPYTINISDEAYAQFPEYIIFHETKHLVDCLTKGWSEEGTPDQFARFLCLKCGYRCPPAHQHYNSILFNGTQRANVVWFQCSCVP